MANSSVMTIKAHVRSWLMRNMRSLLPNGSGTGKQSRLARPWRRGWRLGKKKV